MSSSGLVVLQLINSSVCPRGPATACVREQGFWDGMKAGKKAFKMRQARTKHHLDAIAERRRKGVASPEQGFKPPGSNNLRK